MFSPDGRWIAYASDESSRGRWDVYVLPFPGPGGKWRISSASGDHPHWSSTSRELLFQVQGGQDQTLVAPYSVVGDSVRPEKTQVWSPTRYRRLGVEHAFDIYPDGKRLALIARVDETSGAVQDKVVFFFGFGDCLK